MKGVPSEVSSSERKDRQFWIGTDGKLNGVAQIQKVTTGAGKRLEHPTPVHKTKSVWLYATHPSMRSREEQEQPSTVGG